MVLETNVLHIGDKRYNAGDERIENDCLNFSHTHTHTQLAAVTSRQNLCRDDRYSQVLTSKNGKYHALVLTLSTLLHRRHPQVILLTSIGR